MKRFNYMRPVLLIAIALLTKSLVTNLSMLVGINPELASNLGFIAMIIAALVVFTRFEKNKKNRT